MRQLRSYILLRFGTTITFSIAKMAELGMREVYLQFDYDAVRHVYIREICCMKTCELFVRFVVRSYISDNCCCKLTLLISGANYGLSIQ